MPNLLSANTQASGQLLCRHRRAQMAFKSRRASRRTDRQQRNKYTTQYDDTTQAIEMWKGGFKLTIFALRSVGSTQQ